jgi:phage terminase large subunit GpA-like protein
MSDASTAWLDQTRDLVDSVGVRCYTLPPEETLSEWAETYRVLASESSSIQGTFSFDSIPYMREICNSIFDPRINKVAVMGPSRMAKTETVLLNPIAYVIHRRPSPILVLIPQDKLLKKFLNHKLEPLLRTTPCLRGKIGKDVRTLKDRANNAVTKAFLGGSITLANANSPESYRMIESWITLIDEADEADKDIGGQGDIATLAAARGRTFPDGKLVITSSPTVEGSSIIEAECLASTDEYYFTPCPGDDCRYMQRLQVEQMRWLDGWLECKACHRHFAQFKWLSICDRGEWRATNEAHGTRSFRLDGLLSPWLNWFEFIQEWQKALVLAKQGSMSRLKTLKNTSLGLLWEPDDEGEKLEYEVLYTRREVYLPGEVPEQALVLTCGADTMDHWLAYSVWAWGLDTEGWLIDYGIIEGEVEFDPETFPKSPWNRLTALTVDRVFQRGADTMKIEREFVDYQGHKTEAVYRYTRGKSPLLYAIRGAGGEQPQTIKTFHPDAQKPTRKELAVDSLKSELATRLKVATPGPAFIHFPKTSQGLPDRGADENYFIGLTSEYRKEKKVNGLTTYAWTNPSGIRNESWDTLVYAYAALLDLGGADYLKRMAELRANPNTVIEPPRWQLNPLVGQPQTAQASNPLGGTVYQGYQSWRSNT